MRGRTGLTRQFFMVAPSSAVHVAGLHPQRFILDVASMIGGSLGRKTATVRNSAGQVLTARFR
jgi:hypothetical protein